MSDAECYLLSRSLEWSRTPKGYQTKSSFGRSNTCTVSVLEETIFITTVDLSWTGGRVVSQVIMMCSKQSLEWHHQIRIKTEVVRRSKNCILGEVNEHEEVNSSQRHRERNLLDSRPHTLLGNSTPFKSTLNQKCCLEIKEIVSWKRQMMAKTSMAVAGISKKQPSEHISIVLYTQIINK